MWLQVSLGDRMTVDARPLLQTGQKEQLLGLGQAIVADKHVQVIHCVLRESTSLGPTACHSNAHMRLHTDDAR
jgi:hypothetical protein